MLNRDQIRSMIPHSGPMSLLESVVDRDEHSIRCMALSHRDPANPLASEGTLGIACAVEYAAQAMAVHGALTGKADARRMGYLASVRALACHAGRLDDLPADLEIKASQLAAEDTRVMYEFSLSCAGRLLAEGRAAVLLDGQQP